MNELPSRSGLGFPVTEPTRSPVRGESSFADAAAKAMVLGRRNDLELLYQGLSMRLTFPYLETPTRLRLTGSLVLVSSAILHPKLSGIAQVNEDGERIANDTKLMLVAGQLMAGAESDLFDSFSEVTADAIVSHNKADLQVAHDQLLRLKFSAYPEVSDIAEGMMDIVKPALAHIQ